MESQLEIQAWVNNRKVDTTTFEIDYLLPLPNNFEQNPRLGFARNFIKNAIADNYQTLKPGDHFKDPILLFELSILEIATENVAKMPTASILKVKAILKG